MLERDDEYTFLSKHYKLEKIDLDHFKSFLKVQSKDGNFIFDILSRCLISAKNNFIKLYDQKIGIRNIHFLDRSVDEAFYHMFFTVLIKDS